MCEGAELGRGDRQPWEGGRAHASWWWWRTGVEGAEGSLEVWREVRTATRNGGGRDVKGKTRNGEGNE